MLKGVNKSVIEINCTDNEFFEKAVLFVRPERQISNSSKLSSYADKYLESLHPISSKSKKSSKISVFISQLLASAVFGAALTFFLLKI